METKKIIIPNGCFTVNNLDKNTHRTVKIHTAKGKLEGKRIISLLTGPDNNTSYSGFGFVNDDGSIHLWRRHSGSATKRWLASFVAAKFNDVEFDHPHLEWLVEKRCIVCNKRLTTPESIEHGIGPICAGRGR